MKTITIIENVAEFLNNLHLSDEEIEIASSYLIEIHTLYSNDEISNGDILCIQVRNWIQESIKNLNQMYVEMFAIDGNIDNYDSILKLLIKIKLLTDENWFFEYKEN